MMNGCRVSVQLQRDDTVDLAGVRLLLPRPIDTGFSHFSEFRHSGVIAEGELQALNSHQSAYLFQPQIGASALPVFEYRFDVAPATLPDWFWQLDDNRYTQASQELIAQARDITGRCVDPSDMLRRLMQHGAEMFGYGHEAVRFNDGYDQVPSLCGTTRGSCVDINTYLMAAARSLDIPVQYMAGYWFHPQKTETRDMHCWLVFLLDDEVVYWDLAHHLKWGVDKLGPGLNPAGGRRVPMSCGRGLRFDTPNGAVTISHFSQPVAILPDGRCIEPRLKITIDESV